MLDWSHDLLLRAVERELDGDYDCAALEDLLTVGFAERDGAALRLTDSGRAALALGVPSRRERWALRATTGAALVLALATIGEHIF